MTGTKKTKSTRKLNRTELLFLDTLKAGIGLGEYPDLSGYEEPVSAYAASRKVLPMLYSDNTGIGAFARDAAVRCAESFYKLFYAAGNATYLLKSAGIDACLLKGITIAALYPLSEYRASSDVDILIRKACEMDSAVETLVKGGWKEEPDRQPHHVSLRNSSGILLELHGKPVRPFNVAKADKVIEEIFSENNLSFVPFRFFETDFEVLEPAVNAFYILIHSLEHFMTKGMGIKLLTDWAMLWNREYEPSVYEKYNELTDRAGLKGFSDCLTEIAVRYLCLPTGYAKPICANIESICSSDGEIAETVLTDTLDSGSIGEKNKNRLVNSESSGLGGLLKRFHGCMKENYPKASKIWLVWPILWIGTFFIFIRNNKKVRGVSTAEVIKNARERGRISEAMNLFK